MSIHVTIDCPCECTLGQDACNGVSVLETPTDPNSKSYHYWDSYPPGRYWSRRLAPRVVERVEKGQKRKREPIKVVFKLPVIKEEN